MINIRVLTKKKIEHDETLVIITLVGFLNFNSQGTSVTFISVRRLKVQVNYYVVIVLSRPTVMAIGSFFIPIFRCLILQSIRNVHCIINCFILVQKSTTFNALFLVKHCLCFTFSVLKSRFFRVQYIKTAR